MTLASAARSEHLRAAAMVSASAVRLSITRDVSIQARAARSVTFSQLAGHALANTGRRRRGLQVLCVRPPRTVN